jgi:hypothetical protein
MAVSLLSLPAGACERPTCRRGAVLTLSASDLVALSLASNQERRRDPYRSLNLPKERAEKVRALLDRVRKENRQLRERLEDQRRDLYREYRGYRYDQKRCRKLMGEIRATQDELLELHHRFQDDLRAHLTQPEFEKLQRNLAEARRRDNDDR